MPIWALAPGGPGEAAGLEVGDQVLEIDGRVHPLPHLALNGQGKPVKLVVRRAAGSEAFEVTLNRSEIPKGSVREFSVSDIYLSREGDLWAGLSWGGEIARHTPHKESGASWQVYTARDGLGPGDRPRITQTQDGAIWTVSNHFVAHINRFDGENWSHLSPSELKNNNIHTSLLETRDRTLWIGGQQGRLFAFRDSTWQMWTETQLPISEARVTGLLETADGALWIAGLGLEAARLDYRTSKWTGFEGLHFQCEASDGTQWFISKDMKIVRFDRSRPDGEMWVQYGIQDGIMDNPTALLVTGKGVVWAAGGHEGEAASARFDRTGWIRRTYPGFTQSIGGQSFFESLDGSLWLGAAVGRDTDSGHLGGVLQLKRSEETGMPVWVHHTPPEAPSYAYGISQTSDGVLWFLGSRLYRFDGKTWSWMREPRVLSTFLHGIWGTGEGGLWVGTRAYGLFHFDGQDWTRHGVRDGLSSNRIRVILQTDDKSVWVGTDKGISRFDGRTWMTHALPAKLEVGNESLRKGRDGSLWINAGERAKTTRYRFEVSPPETEITVSVDRVSQPGNTSLSWRGTDPWGVTPRSELQYAWRLDEESWSSFSAEVNTTLLTLPSGQHTFEVKARDRDFNEDPTPAAVRFTVVPPIWQEPWFIAMVVVLIGGIGLQTGRVILRDRKLQESNEGLQKTDDLTVEATLERVRAEALGMQASEDLHTVSAALFEAFESLDFAMLRFAITIVDDEADTVLEFPVRKGYDGKHIYRFSLREWSEGVTQNGQSMEARKEGLPHFIYERAGEDLVEYLRQFQSLTKQSEAWFENALLLTPDPMIGHHVFFLHGVIGFVGGVRFSEADLAVAKRFTDVFDLAYRRFLELQEKEERSRELAAANQAMSEAINELSQANQALQRDRAVERIRGQVQAMAQVSDFEKVLSQLSEDLKAVGLSFDTCGIDVLDEPVEEPTMAYFEDHGFHHTTYTIDPDGTVTLESNPLSAPFSRVMRETMDRFIAGEPWQGRSGETAIVEVPVLGYGRLWMMASDRERFSGEEVRTLQDFAEAVALGYARFLDFQEMLERERAKQSAEGANRAKSTFMGRMSHELRTPLNAILGFTQIMTRDQTVSNKNKERLKTINSSSEHLLRLINDVLEMSSIEAGRTGLNPVSFDLHHLIDGLDGMFRLRAEEKDLQLICHKSPRLPRQVHTDEAKLLKVLINLLDNAIKFTEKGSVTLNAACDGQRLSFEVEDSGSGIDPADMENLFEAFVQPDVGFLAQEGLGLGLPICQEYVRLMDGEITVSSQVGQGATFKFDVQTEQIEHLNADADGLGQELPV